MIELKIEQADNGWVLSFIGNSDGAMEIYSLDEKEALMDRVSGLLEWAAVD